MKENNSTTEEFLKTEEEFLITEEEIKVADMNVEGMPWHVPAKLINTEMENPIEPLSRKETFKLMFGALGAALVVGIIFLIVFFLFILFCLTIWF